MKIKNYPGLAESIYNYRPCSRWGLARHPSTKGSPCICAGAKMRPSIYAGQERNSQRCIKRTYHVKANSNSNLLLIKYAIPPIAKHKGKRTVDWGDDNQITIWNQIEKEFPRAGLRAE